MIGVHDNQCVSALLPLGRRTVFSVNHSDSLITSADAQLNALPIHGR